ncbi:fungal-specific transcription factor domain-containing protein [Apodospora peruviana]|uniref:Fungal-specific transcription factor domain-containing protein n=1 Tax=Apodospora peruviana TaxID=516989 RepID=A0AAE0IBG3_9PEZI|nr:fungal-specific transcription factor domain-containing protein [Apodospora peruviana]
MPPKRKVPGTDISSDTNRVTTADPDSAVVPALVPVKRQRVSRACDQCRAAREKCDGVQPHCFPCVSQKRSCTYQVNPRKRGVQTGYIRTLEIALALVFEKVTGSEDALNAVLTQQGSHGQIVLAGKDPNGAERLHRRWSKSRVHRCIDHILSGGDSAPPGTPSPDRRSLSPEANDAEDDTPRPSLGQSPRVRSENAPHVPSPSDGAARPSSAYRSTSTSATLLRLPTNHWRLLDIYFSYTHSWLPILEKQDLFQASYRYSDQDLAVNPRESSSAVHAELWSALALASFQDSATSTAALQPEADVLGRSPADIFAVARSLVPLENGPFQLHHSRALLLLSLISLGKGDLTAAWLLVGSAIRISIDLNRHRSSHDGREQRRMQSVLIACFIVDTIVSVRYDRPPQLDTEDVDCVFPVSEDGLDQWEPWAACEGFGVANPGVHVPRSPAYCQSTFNQLYRILKLVAGEMSARGGRPTPGGRTLPFISELRQAVSPHAPFGNFTISAEIGAGPVPTAYLIRFVYLWAEALIEPQTPYWVARIQDTIHHYQTQFGACSIPPFIPSCLISLSTSSNQANDGELDKQHFDELVSVLSEIWGRKGQATNTTPPYQISPMTEPNPTSSGLTRSTQPSAPVGSATMPADLPTPSLYSDVPPSQTENAGYRHLNASSRADPYQQQSSTFLEAPPATLPQSSNVNVHMQGSFVAGGIPRMHTSSIHALPYAGFGDNSSMDYDALLDNLASIECTDPVDVDPQFMTNLGFAPGCDFSDILTREFPDI